MSPCIQMGHCGGDADRAWTLPAGILNILWADIYPRLVAQYWLNGQGVWPGITKAELAHEIDQLPSDPIHRPEFHKRKCLVRDYLTRERTVPISVPAKGAYDFLLYGNGPGGDEGGLELFIPERPADEAAVIRFYSFRETGRPALGLPFYLATPYSAVAVDAPRGPGMVWVADVWLQGLLQRLGDECECVVCAIEDLLPPPGRRGAPHAGPDHGHHAGPHWPVGPWRRHDEAQYVRFEDFDAYTCLVRKTRCWQIEGTLYRALMTEVPRIVATIWLEHFLGCAGGDYAARFALPGNGGLRSIFEERLELSLPDEDHMAFATHNGQNTFTWDPQLALPACNNCDVVDEYADGNDVIITNQGFFFPEADPAPTFTTNQLLAEVYEGRAGNPVFSSTDRTAMF